MKVFTARLRRILSILILVLPLNLELQAGAPELEMRHVEASAFTSPPALNLDIPDGAYDGGLPSMASSSLTVSGYANYAGYITLTIWMDHAAAGDLVIKLQGPNGSVITLLSRPGFDELLMGGCGGSRSRMSKENPIYYDDRNAIPSEEMDAGPDGIIGGPVENPYPFRPARDSEAPPDDLVSAFAGDAANGVWTLYIGDACSNGKTGTLDKWSLEILPAVKVNYVTDDPAQGLTFAIDNSAGAGGGIQALAVRYGAGTPLRRVVSQLLHQAGASPDPAFNVLAQAFLHQLSYSPPALSDLTLADFSTAEVILVDDTQVISAPAGWGSSLDGIWLKPGEGFLYAAGQEATVDLGVRGTPNRNYRKMALNGNVVTLHSTSAHYTGFASFFHPFELALPSLRR